MFSEIGELRKTTPHLLADLAELIVLFKFENFDELSQSSFEGLVQTGVMSLDDTNDSYADGDSEGCSSVEISDRTSRYVDDLWMHLQYRVRAFSDVYPFDLEDDVLRVKSNLSKKHLIYMFLLICSRLRSFDNATGFRQLMAKNFTKFSAEVMKCILPDTGEVKIYDWGSEDRTNFFETSNRRGLYKLASFIGAEPNVECIEQEDDTGDSEIDLVGVVNFSEDSAKGYFTLIGQCASQEKNWPNKTFEAHPRKLGVLFRSPCDPHNIFFAPIFYRDSRGEWLMARKVAGPVFIDRKRAINQLLVSTSDVAIYGSDWFTNFVDQVLPDYSDLLVS